MFLYFFELGLYIICSLIVAWILAYCLMFRLVKSLLAHSPCKTFKSKDCYNRGVSFQNLDRNITVDDVSHVSRQYLLHGFHLPLLFTQ